MVIFLGKLSLGLNFLGFSFSFCGGGGFPSIVQNNQKLNIQKYFFQLKVRSNIKTN